jgi:superfamily II DNA or RNA helicase
VVRRGFDDPRRFSAYLHTLRWSSVTSTNPRLFQAPYRAGIEVMAYQLEPLRKALLLPRVNLFIADDVGLGKTIEAALITRELLLRQKVRRIVVACPPSVVLQWQAELESRFGLQFVIFDREYVIERRRERGYSTNPWATHTRFIISHALLRDETYAAPLRDWLLSEEDASGSPSPSGRGGWGVRSAGEKGLGAVVREPRGTLLILDEAHNAAPASGGKYAIDSRFTRVIREIAPLFEHRLFLSATPHNGHSNSFSALLEILDPHRFCRGVKVIPRHLDAVMVRRLKSDLKEAAVEFPRRKVVQVDLSDLPQDAPELALARLLDEYRVLREERVKNASKTARAAVAIVLTALQKRLLSSIEAFAATLRVHRRSLEKARAAETKKRAGSFETRQLSLLDAPGPDDERAELSEADVREAEEQELDLATEAIAASADLDARERALLDRMTEIAEASRGLPDARVRFLVDFLRNHACPDLPPLGSSSHGQKPAQWSSPPEDDKAAVRRILIFTEYADTKRWLDEQLRAALAGTDRADDRVATFHGGMDEESREEIKRAFNADLSVHPLRVLIATDAAREGVNLQGRCADLFHFDVPWNPSRMEQRNGRIDRKNQPSPEVRCHYFVYAQRPEDRVLSTLVTKTANIQRELGSLSPVLESRLARLLEGGIRHADADRLLGDIHRTDLDPDYRAVVDEELEAAARARQDLLIQQLSSLKQLMAQAEKALGFDEKHFRDAVSVSLEMLGTKGLRPIEVELSPGDKPRAAYSLPVDEPRLMKDPTWADTLDSLRSPKPRGQKDWEWRKTAPIRPVVFRDTGRLDDRLVHLHLEHRLVQRLLGRFMAQGFVYDDLSRATVVRSGDAIDRVVLLGRLSLYGERAARLHDEIVVVAAKWEDPRVRKEPLEPYADESTAVRLLDEALEEENLRERRPIPEDAHRKLVAAVERDVVELSGPLQALADARARRAEDLLAARGAREAKELSDVLELQRTRIKKMVDEADTPQLNLLFKGFDDNERRQLEADLRHWKKRLGELERELSEEPERIEVGYRVRAKRVDLVGIAYLWGRAS